jgi:hypothetical protein
MAKWTLGLAVGMGTLLGVCHVSGAAGGAATTRSARPIVVPKDYVKWLERAEAELPLITDAKGKLSASKVVVASRASVLVYRGLRAEAITLAKRQPIEIRPLIFFSILTALDLNGDAAGAIAMVPLIDNADLRDSANDFLSSQALKAGDETGAARYASQIQSPFRRSMAYSSIATRQVLQGKLEAGNRTAKLISDEMYQKGFDSLLRAETICMEGGDLKKAAAEHGWKLEDLRHDLATIASARAKAGKIDEARRIADQIPAPFQRASAYRDIAFALNRAGNHAESLRLFQVSLNFLKDVKEADTLESSFVPSMMLVTAMGQREAWDNDAALQTLKSARELLGDAAPANFGESVTVPILVQQGKIEEAIQVTGTAREYFVFAPPLAHALLQANREDDLWRWVKTLKDPDARAWTYFGIASDLLNSANPQFQSN